jgi:hypothetical protein
MKKTLAGTISSALILVGGTFGFYDHKLGAAEEEVAAIQSELDGTKEALEKTKYEKVEIIEKLLYSKVRLDEIPDVTPEISFTEIQQAYMNLMEEKGILIDMQDGQTDLFAELRSKSVEERSACIIQ